MRNVQTQKTTKKALEQVESKKLREEWVKKNTEAVDACNKLTEEFGLFSYSYRKF